MQIHQLRIHVFAQSVHVHEILGKLLDYCLFSLNWALGWRWWLLNLFALHGFLLQFLQAILEAHLDF